MSITHLQQQFYTDGYTFYRKWRDQSKPNGYTERWEKVSLRKILNTLREYHKDISNQDEVVVQSLERITYGNEVLEASYVIIKAELGKH